MQDETYPFGRSNNFFVGEGFIVPVEDADDELSSNSSLSSKLSIMGKSGGSFANCAFAKDLCNSLMAYTGSNQFG